MKSILKYLGVFLLLFGVVCLVVYKYANPVNGLLVAGIALELVGILSYIIINKKLDMQVIAEGVETEAQFENLSGINCDLFQGFLFSQPIPLEEFEQLYQQEKEV